MLRRVVIGGGLVEYLKVTNARSPKLQHLLSHLKLHLIQFYFLVQYRHSSVQ